MSAYFGRDCELATYSPACTAVHRSTPSEAAQLCRFTSPCPSHVCALYAEYVCTYILGIFSNHDQHHASGPLRIQDPQDPQEGMRGSMLLLPFLTRILFPTVVQHRNAPWRRGKPSRAHADCQHSNSCTGQANGTALPSALLPYWTAAQEAQRTQDRTCRRACPEACPIRLRLPRWCLGHTSGPGPSLVIHGPIKMTTTSDHPSHTHMRPVGATCEPWV